ncbi:hypothetical protein ACVIGA_005775 [Bradyrhizobium sp. USDA 3240]
MCGHIKRTQKNALSRIGPAKQPNRANFREADEICDPGRRGPNFLRPIALPRLRARTRVRPGRFQAARSLLPPAATRSVFGSAAICEGDAMYRLRPIRTRAVAKQPLSAESVVATVLMSIMQIWIVRMLVAKRRVEMPVRMRLRCRGFSMQMLVVFCGGSSEVTRSGDVDPESRPQASVQRNSGLPRGRVHSRYLQGILFLSGDGIR